LGEWPSVWRGFVLQIWPPPETEHTPLRRVHPGFCGRRLAIKGVIL
jgi:hypothetical protein